MLQSNRWKLRYPIAAGYAVPVVLSVLSAIAVLLTVETAQKQTDELKTAIASTTDIGTLALNAEGLSRAARGYLLDRDPRSLENYRREIEEFRQVSGQLLQEIKDPQQLQILQDLVDLVEELDEINGRLIDLVSAGNTQEAIAIWRQEDIRSYTDEVESLLRAFIDRDSIVVAEAEDKQDAALQTLVGTVVISTLLSLVLAVTIGIFIISSIAGRMNRAAGDVASSSAQIAATIEQQERSANQQAASVNETTTTMDELGASSQQVTEQTESAADSANRALHRAEGGTKAVDRSIEGMGRLREKVTAISQQIVHLSEQTNQIGNISTLVSDLANQTNMLALNAAVEAVRAGEHGRGFSVVAQEIRKLADESKRSAQKISTLVFDIQDAINSTVMATDEGNRTVEEGVKISHETSEAFTGVKEAINDVVANNQQISLTIRQQVTAIQQVVDAMNLLNSAAQETANGITQTKQGTQQLNEAALNLKEMV